MANVAVEAVGLAEGLPCRSSERLVLWLAAFGHSLVGVSLVTIGTVTSSDLPGRASRSTTRQASKTARSKAGDVTFAVSRRETRVVYVRENVRRAGFSRQYQKARRLLTGYGLPPFPS